MPRRDFHFAGHALRVEAPEEPLAWLLEFVAPQFAARDTDAPDRTIALTIDPREHARLAGHGPHPQRLTRACFTLDSGILSGRVWNVPGAARWCSTGGTKCSTGAGPARQRSRSSRLAMTPTARVAFMRAVREYAMLYATQAGWLMLHAAAVCVGGDAFVIAGPKRAGKTSLLLHALRNEQGAYVSNDRVALGAEPAGVTAYGIPTIVMIRKESTVWFAGLEAQLAGARYHFRHRVAEKAAPEAAPSRPAATWPLSPAQLCHLLGVESRASARVMAVLFPRVGTSQGGMTFEELNIEQALDAWRGAVFRSCPPDGMFAIGQTTAAHPKRARAGSLPRAELLVPARSGCLWRRRPLAVELGSGSGVSRSTGKPFHPRVTRRPFHRGLSPRMPRSAGGLDRRPRPGSR